MERLGELLVRRGFATATDVQRGLQSMVVHGGRLGTNLVELGLLSEHTVATALGEQHGVQPWTPDLGEPDPSVVQSVSGVICNDYNVMPFRVQNGALLLLMADPRGSSAGLVSKLGVDVVPLACPVGRLEAWLLEYYGIERGMRYSTVAAAAESTVGSGDGAAPMRSILVDTAFDEKGAAGLDEVIDLAEVVAEPAPDADDFFASLADTGAESGAPATPAAWTASAPAVITPSPSLSAAAPSLVAPEPPRGPVPVPRQPSRVRIVPTQSIPTPPVAPPPVEESIAVVTGELEPEAIVAPLETAIAPADAAEDPLPAAIMGTLIEEDEAQAAAAQGDAHLVPSAQEPAPEPQAAPEAPATEDTLSDVPGSSISWGDAVAWNDDAPADAPVAAAIDEGADTQVSPDAETVEFAAHELLAPAQVPPAAPTEELEVPVMHPPAPEAPWAAPEGTSGEASAEVPTPGATGLADLFDEASALVDAIADADNSPLARLQTLAAAARPDEALSFEAAYDALQRAETGEQVLRTFARYTLSHFRRVLGFGVQRNLALGQMAMGDRVDDGLARKLVIPLGPPSVLLAAYNTGRPAMASLGEAQLDRLFLHVLGGERPDEAFVVPLLADGQVVQLVYADCALRPPVPEEEAQLVMLAAEARTVYKRLLNVEVT